MVSESPMFKVMLRQLQSCGTGGDTGLAVFTWGQGRPRAQPAPVGAETAVDVGYKTWWLL